MPSFHLLFCYLAVASLDMELQTRSLKFFHLHSMSLLKAAGMTDMIEEKSSYNTAHKTEQMELFIYYAYM